MYIRFFADTTNSPLGVTALEYARSLMRVAPLRVVSVTGLFSGPWTAYEKLMATPMVGGLINAVCCDPARWTWIQKVPMPEADISSEDMKALAATGAAPAALSKKPAEVLSERVGFYTIGVRNILFAAAVPRAQAEIVEAAKYECIVTPNTTLRERLRGLRIITDPPTGSRLDPIITISVPVDGRPDGHQAIRDVVFPRPSA